MQRVKLAAAVALAICLALPISTCTHYIGETDQLASRADGEALPPGVRKRVTENYPVETWSDSPWALLWLWPLLAVAAQRVVARRRLRTVLWWLEAPLWVLSALSILSRTLFGQPAPGFYLACASLGVYAIAWLSQGVSRIRTRFRAA